MTEDVPNRPINILVLHAHWGNRGDEAALRAMIDSLRADLPHQTMSILLLGGPPFPYPDIDLLDPFPHLWLGRNRAVLEALDALLTIASFGRLALTRRGKRFLQAVGKADMVIHAPGGPAIGDQYGFVEFTYLYRLLIASAIRHKPLFFYAPSMGPFSGKLRNWLRRLVLRRAAPIVVREEISSGYLKTQLGINAIVALDSAFQNDAPDQEQAASFRDILRQATESRTVGLVVNDLRLIPAFRHSPEQAASIEVAVTEIAANLSAKGYRLVLIPQLFSPFEDMGLLTRIWEHDKENTIICPPEADAYAQQILISRLFSVVTMRYHPMVFAAKYCVPFVSVCYEHKAEGFARKVGLPEYAVPVQEMSVKRIMEVFQSLEREHEQIRRHLTALNPSLREESRKTNRILLERIRRLGW